MNKLKEIVRRHCDAPAKVKADYRKIFDAFNKLKIYVSDIGSSITQENPDGVSSSADKILKQCDLIIKHCNAIKTTSKNLWKAETGNSNLALNNQTKEASEKIKNMASNVAVVSLDAGKKVYEIGKLLMAKKFNEIGKLWDAANEDVKRQADSDNEMTHGLSLLRTINSIILDVRGK